MKKKIRTILIAFWIICIPFLQSKASLNNNHLIPLGLGANWDAGTVTGIQGLGMHFYIYNVGINLGYAYLFPSRNVAWAPDHLFKTEINFYFRKILPKRILPFGGFGFAYINEQITPAGRELLGGEVEGNLKAYAFYGGVKYLFNRYFGLSGSLGYMFWDKSDELGKRISNRPIKTLPVYFQIKAFVNFAFDIKLKHKTVLGREEKEERKEMAYGSAEELKYKITQKAEKIEKVEEKTFVKKSEEESYKSSIPEEEKEKKIIPYEIKKGDCLWKIAEKLLGNPWRWIEIYEMNRDVIKDPDLIYPGQIIKIEIIK